MFFLSKKKMQHDTGCLVCHVVVSVLLFLATVAAITGVVMSHYDARSDILIFGTNASSLSLIAFAFCLTQWMKSLKYCMTKCEVCGVNGKK